MMKFRNMRGNKMGTVYTELTLRNESDVGMAKKGYLKSSEIRSVTVTAIVDTGAYSLLIDDITMQKLGLGKTGEQKIRIANGERLICPVTDAVEINWKDRQTVMRTVAVPGLPQTLLGVIPMEALDLIVHHKKQELVGAHGDEVEYMAMKF